MLTILILAAGASSRMKGRDKLTLRVDGAPMLATVIARAQKTRCEVLVALPPDNPARAAITSDSGARFITIGNATQGMGASIAAATAARPKGTTALMILPADMPLIDTADLNTMIRAWSLATETTILRATSVEGKPGHPVIFPQCCFPALEALGGDAGARDILRAHDGPVVPVPLPDQHALLDIDTRDDWEEFLRNKSIYSK